MGKKLDQKREFGTIHGSSDGACFVQDGLVFDALGDEIGAPAKAPAAKAPAAKAATTSAAKAPAKAPAAKAATAPAPAAAPVAPAGDIDDQVAKMLEGDNGGLES